MLRDPCWWMAHYQRAFSKLQVVLGYVGFKTPVFPSFIIVVISPACLVLYVYSAPTDIVSVTVRGKIRPQNHEILWVSEFPWDQCKVNSINTHLMYSNPSRLLCHCCVLFVFFGRCCLWRTLLTCSINSLNPCPLPPLRFSTSSLSSSLISTFWWWPVPSLCHRWKSDICTHTGPLW